MSVAVIPAARPRERTSTRPASASPASATPLAALVVLLALTAIVPQSVQAPGSVAGLLPSDLALAAVLGWAALDLPWRLMDRRSCWVAGGLLVFVATVLVQTALALQHGRSLTGTGGEARVLLGLGTLFVTLALVADADGRARLGRALAALALVLGAWGVLQALLGLVFDPPPSLGAPTTASYETAGRTVGMYAFPVAALCALAGLAVGAARTSRGRLVLVAIAALNVAATLLAFERTFMAGLAFGIVVLGLRLRGGERVRLLATGLAVLAGLVLALWAVDPVRLAHTGERLASVTRSSADPSLRYRGEESRIVVDQIAARPWVGSGPGATMRIGRPGTDRPIVDRRYAENGYLWLAWKTGVPAAVVACLVLVAAATAPGRGRLPDAPGRALALGGQASLAALALVTLTFGSFAIIAITAVAGVLAGCCLAPLAGGAR